MDVVTSPQFPRRAHQLAGGEMTPAQYHTVARMLRLPEPSAAAARRVLVDGERPSVAAESSGVSPSSLSRTVGRIRRAYDEIAAAGPWEARAAYSPQERAERPGATTLPAPR